MQVIRSDLMLVTPSQAQEWLSQNLYERQRKRAEWQVGRLGRAMEKEEFIAGTQIHFGEWDGHLYLLNGQHTLGGIVRSGQPILLSVLVTRLDSEEQLGQLYGRHDRHRGRTPHDAYAGMGLAERIGLSEVETNAFGSGLKWVLNGFRPLSVHKNAEIVTSIDYLSDEMIAWQETARRYFEHVRPARFGLKGPFRRALVVAVGLVTIKHQEAKAKLFWEGAAEEDMLTKTDPRKALNVFLIRNTSGHGDSIAYLRNVAWAWNKFYENGELLFLRPGDVGKIGVTIRGTPYKAAKKKPLKPSAVEEVIEEEDDLAPMPAVQGVLGEARV